MLVMLMASLDSTIVSTALPTIAGDLGGIAKLSRDEDGDRRGLDLDELRQLRARLLELYRALRAFD